VKLAAIVAYLGVMLSTIVLFNADAENSLLAFSVWSAGSLALGWITGSMAAVVVPLLAIPIALPFGYADQWLGSDAPLVGWFAVVGGAIQIAVVFIAVIARMLYERVHSPHT
jgi:hypothetical protein